MPLVLLLLAAAPRVCGVIVLLALLLAFLPSALVYTNLPVFVSILPKTAGVRLLNFKEGKAIQRYLLAADAVIGNESNGLPLQELRGAHQHTWENRAIAHEGGWDGLGFGYAPTRLSQVRQDTIQYDSVFSFFVVSEHGLIGGFFLLLLYALPLALIFIGGRQRFDIGYGFATLIASAFLIEALFHAGMNLGAFPFTGRNLPLLAVASLNGDLMRWVVMFCLATLAIFWRYRGKGEYKDEAVSLIHLASAGQPPVTLSPPSRLSRSKVYQQAVVWISKIPALVWIVSVPAIMFLLVVSAGWATLRDQELDKPFGWDVMLDQVDRLIKKGDIKVDQENKLQPDEGRLGVSYDMLIKQEIERFNALPLEERLQAGKLKDFQYKLASINSLDSYAQLLDQARKDSLTGQQRRRPNLFKLIPKPELSDEVYIQDADDYIVAVNQDYNTRLSFKAGLKEQEIPKTTFRDGKSMLIGPAWVMGRWVMARNADSPIPWLTPLSWELTAAWSRFGSQAASEQYGRLSLDLKLQKAALDFAAEKGRKLHAELLRNQNSYQITKLTLNNLKSEGVPADALSRLQLIQNRVYIGEGNFVSTLNSMIGGEQVAAYRAVILKHAFEFAKRLPPRVALSIISLPGGEALALGGWPYTTPDRFWRKEQTLTGRDVLTEWVPPVEWAAEEAPTYLQVRHERDRNFDLLVMGSSTKPLWATAALGVHPRLHQQLQVRGPAGEESEVFGIGITPGWIVKGSNWRDFKTYLAQSDNRYQIRLGFLGLAEADGAEVVADAGVSNSDRESMSGGNPVAWMRYPKFPSLIRFSKDQPGTVMNLHETPLAKHLKGMYSIGIHGNEFGYRLSLWSKDENDDLIPKNNSPGLFRTVSPPAVNFELDRLEHPRQYVSLLLGGFTNRWANIDMAAAFGTCVTGTPVVANIVRNQKNIIPLPGRERFPEIAARVRAGLAAVITEGTAKANLQQTGALSFLTGLPGTKVYAKTGTLRPKRADRNTSRLVLAIVRWKDERQGLAQAGLVLSLVCEEADVGTATTWMGEFLMRNKADIERLLATGNPSP